MKQSLENWLETNKITYNWEDKKTINIPSFGMCYFDDAETMPILRKGTKKDDDGKRIETFTYTIPAPPDELIAEGVNYSIFKFGDNWYYTDLREEFKLNILKYIGKRVKDTIKYNFANIGIHTPYELLNGSFMPAEWAKKAAWLGHKYMGICDRNTMAGTFPTQKDAGGIGVVFGYSLTVLDGTKKFDGKVYVCADEGLQNLLRIQKAIMVDSDSQTITLDELLFLSGGLFFVFQNTSIQHVLNDITVADRIIDSFQEVFFQVDSTEYRANIIDEKYLEYLKLYVRNLYKDETKPFIAPVLISDSYYLDKDDAINKITLNKIATKAAHNQSSEQYFKSSEEHYLALRPLFENMIENEGFDFDAFFEDMCENALYIAETGSGVKFASGTMYMPEYEMTPEETEKYGDRLTMFNSLLEDGFKKYVPEGQEELYRDRLEKEKYVIMSTNNVDYFLVMYDLTNWCRKNDVLTAYGRGSAGGALLSYFLGIIKIDPIKYDLIFERFLIPERAGLYDATVNKVVGEKASSDYVEIDLGSKKCKIDAKNEVIVLRDQKELRILASEIQKGDDLLIDNYDELWTLK